MDPQNKTKKGNKIMSSFLKTASKQVADVRNFLRESAGGQSIKYSAEKGAKHIIYIPFTTEQVVDQATGAEVLEKKICAIQGAVHEWSTQDGKFKATVCLRDVIRHQDENDPNSPLINDGSCPFCDRVSDAWDIYRYRKEAEEATCQLTGEQRKNHLDKTFSAYADERKAKDARVYMYILVVKYRLNEQGKEVIGTDGLPEYDLKVMKLSASRVEKIQQQIANSGSELPDSELIFEYPNVDDRRLLVSQSTTAPVFPNNRMIAKYPALKDKINQDIAKFEWDGIEKSFPEWAGMSSIEAKSITDSMFEQWDSYKKELSTNPTAKYLEYVMETPTAKPSLGGEGIGVAPAAGIPVIPQIPNVPVVPTAAPAAAPVAAPTVPTADANGAPAVPPVPTVPTPAPAVAPAAPAADPNAVFSGAAGAAPTVMI